MMARCRPGDLAIVISCPRAPENVGAIVRVIERMPYYEGERIVWICKCASQLAGLRVTAVDGITIVRTAPIAPGEHFLTFDDQLKPIRGPQADQGVQHEHEKELAA